MKIRYLKLYDKMITAIILGLIAFWGCSRKNYPQKSKNSPEQKVGIATDTVRPCDTVIMPKEPGERVIAMYGVPPLKMTK